MHHLTALLVTILSSPHILAQTTTSLAYDPTYDNRYLSLDAVACSNGPNGLEAKHYSTLGEVPNFPFVGAVYTVLDWNSPQCGACYAVTYGNTTVGITAVDHSATGFTVSKEAMDFLTNYEAYTLGRVEVTFDQVDASECGIN